MRSIRRVTGLILFVVILSEGIGCRTLQQVANLRNVNFSIDRVADATLAGVAIDRMRSYEELSTAELFRLGEAVAAGRAPMAFTLHLDAENPEENDASARLVEMDWTLLIEDRETVSGTFDRTIALPPGTVQDVPVDIELDLVEFFDRNARDLAELALAIAGEGGAPKRIKLRATPTIDTPIGPLRYPQPVTITVAEVGG